MDVLVEFCRTGELAPLRKGMTAAEVERLLGPPTKVRCMQGEQHLQRHRYGSLSMTISCLDSEPADKEHLRLQALGVSFKELPLDLPVAVAQGVTRSWSSSHVDDIIAILHSADVGTTLTYESTKYGSRYQHLNISSSGVTIVVDDGIVSRISG